MMSTILHWTCDPTSASMATLLFRWATFVPLFLMAGLLTRLAVIPAIVSFTIATKVTIGKDLTSPALPYLFGLIAIFIVGSGLYSVDYWLLYALAGN